MQGQKVSASLRAATTTISSQSETRGLVNHTDEAAIMTGGSAWTFLTNHSHVLLCLAQDPAMRLRDVADKVGITERAVQRIVADLEAGGVLLRTRDGRRNHYVINGRVHLRHPIERHSTLYDFIHGILKTLPSHALLQPEEADVEFPEPEAESNTVSHRNGTKG